MSPPFTGSTSNFVFRSEMMFQLEDSAIHMKIVLIVRSVDVFGPAMGTNASPATPTARIAARDRSFDRAARALYLPFQERVSAEEHEHEEQAVIADLDLVLQEHADDRGQHREEHPRDELIRRSLHEPVDHGEAGEYAEPAHHELTRNLEENRIDVPGYGGQHEPSG